MTNNKKVKKISPTEIEYISRLARIELTKEEKEKFASEISNILFYINQLNEANTITVETSSRDDDKLINVMRCDISKSCGDEERKLILENFPAEKNGYIKIKRVL